MAWESTARIRACGAALLAALACAGPPAPPPLPPAPPGVRTPAPPPCERIARIEVHKGQRLLRVHCERGAVLEMKAALGREPSGPKRGAGDWRTPEGRYRISDAPRASDRYHLFIPIDYPSLEDARTAREEGRISKATYRAIADAHSRGEPPPQGTVLGGDLGFHGEGERWRGDSADLDWTYGCVALSDAEIELLARLVEVGTPVWILP